MDLIELLCSLSCETHHLAPGARRTRVTGIVLDSRNARPGSVFVAVPGERLDGHNYAGDAAQRGAVAVVARRALDLPARVSQVIVPDARLALAALSDTFYDHPSHKVQTVGVTGTNGKSTTCHLTRAILRAAGEESGLIGTLGYDTGQHRSTAHMTTPEAPDIQRLLAEMADENLRYAVMEASSHALVQRRVDFVRFQVGCFTQLTPEHLDFHMTMDAYRDAKARLFSMLDPDGQAVLNADDASSRVLASRTSAPVLWYGLEEEADVCAEITSATLKGIRFKLHSPLGSIAIKCRLVGRHNVYNCLAAASVAIALGLPLEAIHAGIRGVDVVDGRLHPVDYGQPFDCLVDYAHTHHALEAVLTALRPHVVGRVLVVFGAGGDRDRTKRPKMGEVVSRLADEAWVTSDNPRSEDPLRIIQQVLEGATCREKLHVQADRALAICEALAAAREGDLCLIAGKGSERFQVFRDRTVPFDDREVARKFLTGSVFTRQASA